MYVEYCTIGHTKIVVRSQIPIQFKKAYFRPTHCDWIGNVADIQAALLLIIARTPQLWLSTQAYDEIHNIQSLLA